ncbi:MAG: glycoside hydrolase family 97 protein [Bacteroidaceae bacterium]|nr:glycoside hydrolase family 97 protein [Bacteroidaceae bacterium]
MKIIIRTVWLMALALLVPMAVNADEKIFSPDKSIVVDLRTGKGNFGWSVTKNGKKVYTINDIRLIVDGKTLAGDAAVKSVKQKSVSETIKPVVPLKFSTIESKYTEAVLNFGSCKVEMRVMDNAVAYRFVTNMKGEVLVDNEHFTIVPESGFTAHYQQCRSFNTAYEERYQHGEADKWIMENRLATLPMLLSGEKDTQLLIGESDVDDYPRLFLKGNRKGISAALPGAPISWEPWGDRGEIITEEGYYIAKTQGKRTFPWRFVVVTDSKGIIEQTVPVQLARRPVLEDTSWIKPGQVSWEWWNGAIPYGPEVTFRAGNNYDTYAYFVDFAAKYGVEYILLDEGWAKDTRDPYTAKPDMHLDKLIAYGKSKGVGIIIWLPWLTVEQHFDLFEKYAEWGVAGVKIDFMEHSDQWMVNFYKRVVKEAAKHKLLVDMHGSFTPMGLEYEYPNFLSYEGVLGLEQMGGCRPENTLYLPFIRNAVGAADFTPGGMNNRQPDNYTGSRPNSGAAGTRAFQMALYVVLESGIQMLADNPAEYYKNDDCARYIASVPTTWDETRALETEVGKYIIVAKRKGDKWFIGGICEGEQRERVFNVKLDFLGDGEYKLTGFKDGVNADIQAMHYNKVEKKVTKNSTIEIKMVKNGGFAAVIE